MLNRDRLDSGLHENDACSSKMPSENHEECTSLLQVLGDGVCEMWLAEADYYRQIPFAQPTPRFDPQSGLIRFGRRPHDRAWPAVAAANDRFGCACCQVFGLVPRCNLARPTNRNTGYPPQGATGSICIPFWESNPAGNLDSSHTTKEKVPSGTEEPEAKQSDDPEGAIVCGPKVGRTAQQCCGRMEPGVLPTVPISQSSSRR